MRPARPHPTGRCETLGTLVAGVVLRRSQAGPVGRRLDAVAFGRDQVPPDVGSALRQELLDDHLRLPVLSLAEVVMPDPPLRVPEVESRPEVVVEGTPYLVVAVDRDGVVNPHVLHGAADVVGVVLEREL